MEETDEAIGFFFSLDLWAGYAVPAVRAAGVDGIEAGGESRLRLAFGDY